MNRFLFALLALSLSSAVCAEMYRWVDSQGHVHYSDAPPPAGAKSSKTIDTPTSGAPAQATKSKTLQEKDMEFRQRQTAQAEAQAKKDKEEADAKQKKQNCEAARANLRTLESGERVTTMNEKGERIFVDDAARSKGIEEARKGVDTWCK